jgi:hypothetical protein
MYIKDIRTLIPPKETCAFEDFQIGIWLSSLKRFPGVITREFGTCVDNSLPLNGGDGIGSSHNAIGGDGFGTLEGYERISSNGWLYSVEGWQ